jgi:hypothetical protein
VGVGVLRCVGADDLVGDRDEKMPHGPAFIEVTNKSV